MLRREKVHDTSRKRTKRFDKAIEIRNSATMDNEESTAYADLIKNR